MRRMCKWCGEARFLSVSDRQNQLSEAAEDWQTQECHVHWIIRHWSNALVGSTNVYAPVPLITCAIFLTLVDVCVEGTGSVNEKNNEQVEQNGSDSINLGLGSIKRS